MSQQELITRLRARISDSRPSCRAFSLSVTDEGCTRAIGELHDGRLVVTVYGGTAPNINWDLSDQNYATFGRLLDRLARLDGYAIDAGVGVPQDFDSVNLNNVPPCTLGPGRSGMEFLHNLFSDRELLVILERATKRHNPGFSLQTLPETEEEFVLNLATVEACRQQAHDSTKRVGLNKTTDDLLTIAAEYERSYESDVRRLARSLTSPVEADRSTLQEGEIVVGTAFRTNLRTGRKTGLSQNTPPEIPVLLEPDSYDCEDTNILVRWARNYDDDLHALELWLDGTPDVRRSLPGKVTPPSCRQPLREDAGVRSTTSRSVFNSRQDAGLLWSPGQTSVGFVVNDLEPNSTYYLRLYAIDNNGEFSASEVREYRTRALRTRFARTGVSPTRAAAGDTVTLAFDSSYSPVTDDHVVRVGETVVDHTVVSSFVATFVMPTFISKALPKDVSVMSPSGLLTAKFAVLTVR